MSKKPLLSEGTARRWAKYAGIQNKSSDLLTEMYGGDKPTVEEEALEEELEENLEEEMPGEKKADGPLMSEEEGPGDVDEALMAELEELLAEQDDEDEMGDKDMDADTDDMTDAADDMEDAEGMEDEEADEEEAGGMDQQAVEDAVKAGLEAMASAIGDALKIKIDVRSGEDIEDEAGEEEVMEEEAVEEMAKPHGDVEEGHGKMPPVDVDEAAAAGLFEGFGRDELVEAVMKRVVARLVKESKED